MREPLYPLPYSKERQVGQTDSFNLYGSLLLGGQTGIGIGGAADVSRTVNIPTLPEYLTSAEALRRWMESFDWENRPWNAGHNVSSARTEIIQVGLVDVVYEFIEEIQNPDTGLWGKGRTLEEDFGGHEVIGLLRGPALSSGQKDGGKHDLCHKEPYTHRHRSYQESGGSDHHGDHKRRSGI